MTTTRSHIVKKTLVKDGVERPESKGTYTSGGETSVGEVIPGSSTDLEITPVAIPVTGLKSLWIESDVALTIKTNSSSVPGDTLTLGAGVTIDWQHDSPHSCPITTAVTKIYVTEAAGDDANLTIEALFDVTA